MNGYFITVMAVSLAGSVMLSLLPVGSASKYVRLLCGLCVICCVAFPIGRLAVGGLDKESVLSLLDYGTNNKEYYDEIYNNALTDAELKNACELLKSEIIKECNADTESFDVNLVIAENSDEFYIDFVEVVIYPSGISISPREIENVVRSRLNCRCTFIYED